MGDFIRSIVALISKKNKKVVKLKLFATFHFPIIP